MGWGSTAQTGSGTMYVIRVDSQGRQEIVGAAAEDAAVTGAPIQVGGRYDAAARTLDDGDVGGLAIDAAGRVNIVGAAAEDAAAAGNPVLVSGRYDATDRTLDDGDTGGLALDSISRLFSTERYDVLPLTLSLDNGNIYADGDVLAATQEVANAALISGGRIIIDSVVLCDQDDQAGALDLVFSNATITLGTENDAISISDADAAKIVGIVEIVAGDYVDLINNQVVTKTNLGIIGEMAATSLFVSAASRDTKTYTASGITLLIGVKQL